MYVIVPWPRAKIFWGSNIYAVVAVVVVGVVVVVVGIVGVGTGGVVVVVYALQAVDHCWSMFLKEF